MTKSATCTQDTLLKLNAQVGIPDDYFNGRRTADTGLLQNVVLFARRPGCPIALKEFNSFHHRHVLLIALKGSGTVVVNGRSFRVEPGRVLLIGRYQNHHYVGVNVDEIEWLFIMFEGDSLFDDAARMVMAPAEPFGSDLLILVKTYLKPATEATTRQMILRLMLMLDSLREQEPLESHESSQNNPGGDLLMRIHELIARNMNKTLTAKDVSEYLGVSESHLRNRFREASGLSIGNYMRNLRLYRATGLLLQQKMNVSEVAEACGWESAFSFSRAFSAHWGMAPRDFVKKLGKSSPQE